MIFLGVETSCDETALALIQGRKILAHVVHSQNHEKTGGVVPMIAAREHLEMLPDLVERLRHEGGENFKNIQGIGVTAGPGLMAGLLVGAMWAKGFARILDPCFPKIWPIHHVRAHALVAGFQYEVDFPYLALLISGGHCILALVYHAEHFVTLGQSQDDAPGECLDKISRALGGPFPGGAFIEEMAKQGNDKAIPLPIPLEGRPGYDFSFSGLKTAAIQWWQRYGDGPKAALNPSQTLKDFCASLQRVMSKGLCQQLNYALEKTKIKNVVVAGGVASNNYFRKYFQEISQYHEANFYAPSPSYCTDNGVMIAWAASCLAQRGVSPDPNFVVKASWALDIMENI